MADKKISELTTLSPVDNSDYIAVVDVSAGETKKATRADFRGETGATGATGATGPGYTATSTTSLAIGTGSKAFTTQAGLAYTVGARVRASSAGDTSKWMEGLVTAYSSTTLTVSVDLTSGSGTLADWNINLAGERGATGATGSTGPAGQDGTGTVNSVSVVSANGFAGTVATSTTTPAITLSTTITGILSGDGTSVSAASTTGTGNVVRATSPTLVTPTLGAATATTLALNGATLGLNALAVSGTSVFSSTISPTANDAAALGAATVSWSDLFLASGGVVNFANGNYTLTHSSGLLTANGALSIGTSNALTAGTIELGAASDTTISRSSAGVIAVEGVVIPSISSTNTLTNKRITSRVTTITSNATPTINTDDCDCVTITALAANITSMTTNLSGTPTNFQKLIIRIKDDGTARTITWGASFEAKGVALPTTTVISKVLTVGFIYDTVTSKWGCVASAQEA